MSLVKHKRIITMMAWGALFTALLFACGVDSQGNKVIDGQSLGSPDNPDVPDVWDMGSATIVSTRPEGGSDGDAASKGRLLSLVYQNDTAFERVLLTFYSDASGPVVHDLFGNSYKAQDVFVTRSADNGATWSVPVNLSLSANSSTRNADHDGNPETPVLPYYGDVEKPTVFGNAKEVLVAWLSKYCPGDVQGSVIYAEAGMLEVPFSCVYVRRSVDGGQSWGNLEQLTNGLRDAKFIMGHATKAGFAIAWQEDPLGLQPGEAEGPGDGGSGAKVSRGTDIWYTALSTKAFAEGTLFPAPVRISDNFVTSDEGGHESGSTGASRPNVTLAGKGIIIAYEETKGTGGAITGKYIRYHTFPDFTKPTNDPTGGKGWIISDPLENARRVRVFGQGEPGPGSGAKVVFLWRQGKYDQGGPADIMARIGLVTMDDSASTGLRPEDLSPAVAQGCEDAAMALQNVKPLNLSSKMGVGASSDDDFLEDARAHRGFIRGDMIIVGYSWTPDWAVARYTDHENYNFFITRSADGGQTWDCTVNISNISDKKINVREPRIVPTPDSPDPSEQRDTNTFLVAWTTEVNQYDYVAVGAVDLDLFYTLSTDGGVTYKPVTALADTSLHEGESQLKMSADGNRFFAVWVQSSDTGISDISFRAASKESAIICERRHVL